MIKKIIVSSALFGLVYGFITNYGSLVGENNLSLMDRAIITQMDPKYGFIMALLAVGLYLVFSYGKSEKCIQKFRMDLKVRKIFRMLNIDRCLIMWIVIRG